MFCKKCGFALTNQDKTCPNCGEVNNLYVENTVPSTEPVAPAAPVAPVEAEPLPVAPETPVVPAEPAAPVEPVQPEPIQPVQPIQTAAPVAQEPKKSNVGFIILVIVLSLVIVGLGVFIALKLLGGNTNTGTNQPVNNTNTPVEPTNNNNNNGNTNTNEPSPVSTTNTFEYKGITFTLPSGYVALEDEDGKYIKGDAYIYAPTELYYGDYDELVLEAKTEFTSDVIAEFAAEGFTYLTSGETTVDGVKMYYFEFATQTSGTYDSLVFTKLSDNYALIGHVYYFKDYRDTALKTTATILSSGKINTRSVSPEDGEFKFPAMSSRTLE